jgi:hypothetical protein
MFLNKPKLFDFVNEEDLKLLIGAKAPYYFSKWQKMFVKTHSLKGVQKGFSFNFWAAAFPGPWLIYRGMFLSGFLVTVFSAVLLVAVDFSAGFVNLAAWGAEFFLTFFASFKMNSLFFKRACFLIRQKNRHPEKFPLKKQQFFWPSFGAGVLFFLIYLASGVFLIQKEVSQWEKTFEIIDRGLIP